MGEYPVGTPVTLRSYLHRLGTSAVVCDPPNGESESTEARQWIKVDGSGRVVKVRSSLIQPIENVS